MFFSVSKSSCAVSRTHHDLKLSRRALTNIQQTLAKFALMPSTQLRSASAAVGVVCSAMIVSLLLFHSRALTLKLHTKVPRGKRREKTPKYRE